MSSSIIHLSVMTGAVIMLAAGCLQASDADPFADLDASPPGKPKPSSSTDPFGDLDSVRSATPDQNVSADPATASMLKDDVETSFLGGLYGEGFSFKKEIKEDKTPDDSPGPTDEPKQKSRYFRPLPIAGYAIAGVGLIAGSVTGAIALSKASSAKDSCFNETLCGPVTHDDIRSGRTMAKVSNVSFALVTRGTEAYDLRALHKRIDYSAWPMFAHAQKARDVFGRVAHVVAIEGIPQPVLDHRIDQLDVAHLGAGAQMLAVRRQRHRFLAAGDNHLGVAIGDLLHADGNGPQA